MLSTGFCRPRSVGPTRTCGVSRSVAIRSVLQVRCFCVRGMSRRASSRTKAVSPPPRYGWTRRSRFRAVHGFDPGLAALIDGLTYSRAGEELASRALSLLDDRPVPDEQALRASLTPSIWFLDRAAGGRLPLTASGYLKPADVTAAAE